MKRPFETYLAFIEHELGCKLFDWQKDVLFNIYNGDLGRISFGRRGGITMLSKAALILYEEMARDTGNLPPRLHEPDSYAINVVTCDENWGENIIWERRTNNETQ